MASIASQKKKGTTFQELKLNLSIVRFLNGNNQLGFATSTESHIDGKMTRPPERPSVHPLPSSTPWHMSKPSGAPPPGASGTDSSGGYDEPTKRGISLMSTTGPGDTESRYYCGTEEVDPTGIDVTDPEALVQRNTIGRVHVRSSPCASALAHPC